jgi:hypothetical protein
VWAYAHNAKPAIDASTNNAGNGYYVNGRLNFGPLSSTKPITLKVYADDTKAVQYTTLTLPADYQCFAFQIPGHNIQQNYYIEAFDGTAPLGKLGRSADKSPVIYSTSLLADYNPHRGTWAAANSGWLPVRALTTTIDLSETTFNNAGYTVSAGMIPYSAQYPGADVSGGGAVSGTMRTLTFDTAASGNTYKIIQSGWRDPTDGSYNPDRPKTGTSIFGTIAIPTGVTNVTLELESIDLTGTITLAGNARVTLLTGTDTLYLQGPSYDVGSFVSNGILVTRTNGSTASTLTIDSASAPGTHSSAGSLTVTRTTGAGIGGNNTTQNCGIIIINGGTVTANGTSGAGIGGCYSNITGANVTINGGTVTATGGSSCPGIGSGGNSSSTVTNNIITINGGAVTAAGGSAGAGIGSGAFATATPGAGDTIPREGGSVTPTGATPRAGIVGGGNSTAGIITINNGTVNATGSPGSNGNGAGIGGGNGAPSTAGTIKINGGTVTATAAGTGAGIGSGGGSTVTSAGSVSITGGTVTANAASGGGAAIGGCAGRAYVTISITGGTVTANGTSGAGIGAGTGSSQQCNITIGSAAAVRAYSQNTSGTGKLAIDANNDNYPAGTGYYVNARLNAAISPSAPTTLKVYADGTISPVIDTLTLPATFRCFAYSTGAAKRTDNIKAFDGGTQLGTVVRVQDDDRQIYSIIKRNEYSSHGGGSNNMLPVKLENKLYITEKYVDVDGLPLVPPAADTTTILNMVYVYSKTIPAKNGYSAKGYKWDDPPDDATDFTPGSPASLAVTADREIYFVYEQGCALTISNAVAGPLANKTTRFRFAAYFYADAGGTTPLAGSFGYEIKDKAGAQVMAGTLALDGSGQCQFDLKHGESIAINDVPTGCHIRIAETPDGFYDTAFVDGEVGTSEPGNDTAAYGAGLRAISADREFAFTNTRKAIAETGIADMKSIAAFTLPAILAGFGYVALATTRRRRGKRSRRRF